MNHQSIKQNLKYTVYLLRRLLEFVAYIFFSFVICLFVLAKEFEIAVSLIALTLLLFYFLEKSNGRNQVLEFYQNFKRTEIYQKFQKVKFLITLILGSGLIFLFSNQVEIGIVGKALMLICLVITTLIISLRQWEMVYDKDSYLQRMKAEEQRSKQELIRIRLYQFIAIVAGIIIAQTFKKNGW
jgi:hypothetical protein